MNKMADPHGNMFVLTRRTPVKINDVSEGGQKLVFIDEEHDGKDFNNIRISLSTIQRVGMRSAKVNDCSFTQCDFRESYFRQAKFINVNFTGSKFRDCNFDKASFQSCDFRYAKFYNCLMNRDEIAACLPSEPNLRRELARNLRTNFLDLGDKKSADHFLQIETQAYEKELSSIFCSRTEYYKERYELGDRIKACIKWTLSKMSGIVWGYGYRIDRLAKSFGALILIETLISYLFKVPYTDPYSLVERTLSFWESLYASSLALVPSGSLGYVPANVVGKVIVFSENVVGTIFLALLAASIFRKISR